MKKIFIILLLISYYTSTAQVDTNYVNSEVDKLIQSQKNSLEKVDDKLTEQSEKVNQNSQNYYNAQNFQNRDHKQTSDNYHNDKPNTYNPNYNYYHNYQYKNYYGYNYYK